MSDYEARRQVAIEAWRKNNPAKCENCYGTGDADTYFADYQGRMTLHSVTSGSDPCYDCNRTGRSPKTLDGTPRFQELDGVVFAKDINAYACVFDVDDDSTYKDGVATSLSSMLCHLAGKRVSIEIQVLDD